MTTTWFTVGLLTDIPRLSAKVVRVHGTAIAIFRTQSDAVFALEDRCPHKQGPLSQGIVHDKKVTCPLHGWVIDLQDGTAQAPDDGGTPTYPIRITSGVIELGIARLDALARAV